MDAFRRFRRNAFLLGDGNAPANGVKKPSPRGEGAERSEADEVEKQALSSGGRKAPLCKGGCHDLGRDWGIVAVHRTAGELAIFVTIPPSQLTLCHLPLHKGGIGTPEVL